MSYMLGSNDQLTLTRWLKWQGVRWSFGGQKVAGDSRSSFDFDFSRADSPLVWYRSSYLIILIVHTNS